MDSGYCLYPPQLADDVEINEQRDGDRLAFIAGSAAVGRYILLHEAERRVLSLLEDSLAPTVLCQEFTRRHGGKLQLATLAKFLTKLDEVGILAGERGDVRQPEQQIGAQVYYRFSLFNPDPLFTQVVARLRWIWTTQFLVCSLLLMLATAALALMNADEVISYGGYTLREHYLAIVIAGLLVGVTHEFAHGLTCKAFGGRATEVGGLLIYYCLPALYCNVSGVHLIPQRGRRLWVIAAGVYWQLMVGTAALLAWFALAPYTLLADMAFAFFCGSVLDVAFNGNPLIKLDGYYFLSQWLRLPNLMDRSHAYWRGLLKRIRFGEPSQAAAQWSRRERAIYASFGLLSFVYTVGLRFFIVCYAGAYLMDWFHLPGLLFTAGLAIFYTRHPLKQLISAATSLPVRLSGTLFKQQSEDVMANDKQTTNEGSTKLGTWRRRLAPLAICLLIGAVMLMPWNASVGNYGTLVAIPGQEAIIRAPENGKLIELNTRPGDWAASGSVVGRMGNLELEEQIVQAQSELARANADYDRLQGELRARSESAVRADLQLRQRQHDFDEINIEQRMISDRLRLELDTGAARLITASATPAASFTHNDPPDTAAARYPAAIAALQAEAELCRAQMVEAAAQLERSRKLFAGGIMPRSELDAAETRAATRASSLAAARERLASAIIEHRRRHASTATEMQVARSDAGAASLQIEKLGGELSSTRAIIGALEDRRRLLERKRAQFELITPRAGAVFGEDLPRLVGQYFQQGAEICRVADTSQLLLRIQMPEREVADVRIGSVVRLKARAFPDQVFHGVVSKIGGESERDQQDEATYRVELTIENSDSFLRPGMTGFARIEFGRQTVGRILLHKIKRALRPELWML